MLYEIVKCPYKIQKFVYRDTRKKVIGCETSRRAVSVRWSESWLVVIIYYNCENVDFNVAIGALV